MRRKRGDWWANVSFALSVGARDDVLALAGTYDGTIAKMVREAGVDAVFEQGAFLGRGFPIPVVPWIADLQHRSCPEYFSTSHRLARDVGFWSQLRFRKHVIVSSKSSQNDLLRFVPHPRAAIHVVPFAVGEGPALSVNELGRVRQKYELPETFLFLPNQLWRHKNHTTAFRALAELARRGNSVTLALSGDPHDYRAAEYSRELALLAKDVGIESQLRWLGVIPHQDLRCLMAAAAAVLNPSFFEGWSTTVEEAKGVGAQLVLSSLDVHREQAADQSYFFDPHDPSEMADAIGRTLAAPRDWASNYRKALAQNKISQEIYARRLADVFNAAVFCREYPLRHSALHENLQLVFSNPSRSEVIATRPRARELAGSPTRYCGSPARLFPVKQRAAVESNAPIAARAASATETAQPVQALSVTTSRAASAIAPIRIDAASSMKIQSRCSRPVPPSVIVDSPPANRAKISKTSCL